jgi:hypothetical protein
MQRLKEDIDNCRAWRFNRRVREPEDRRSFSREFGCFCSSGDIDFLENGRTLARPVPMGLQSQQAIRSMESVSNDQGAPNQALATLKEAE